MTRYHFDNQEKKQKVSRTRVAVTAFSVIAAAALLVFVVAPAVQNVARGPEWLHGALEKSVSEGVGMLTPKSALLADNAALRAQVESYQAQTLELETLRDENAALRTELSYLPNPKDVLTAAVLAKPSQSLYNSIVIDQGSSHGVAVGQLVTAQGTIGLGRVSSVSAATATVELFSGPEFRGNLVVRGQKSITVPAIGKGGGNFEIHIPREIQVSDGDILAFPDNPEIAVGVAKSILFDARDPFQTVLARVPVNVQELRFVEVVR